MSKLYKLNPPVRVGNIDITLLEVAAYGNGRIAIEAYSVIPAEEGGDGEAVEPFDTLSVNLPEQSLPADDVFFARDYSYHAGMFDAFLAAGLIEIVPGVIGAVGGHGVCAAARLTDKAKLAAG